MKPNIWRSDSTTIPNAHSAQGRCCSASCPHKTCFVRTISAQASLFLHNFRTSQFLFRTISAQAIYVPHNFRTSHVVSAQCLHKGKTFSKTNPQNNESFPKTMFTHKKRTKQLKQIKARFKNKQLQKVFKQNANSSKTTSTNTKHVKP